MADLSTIKAALRRQFIDFYQLALPEESLEEAIRRVLAKLNLSLGAEAELAGLDGASTTSLPLDWFLALFEGAAAQLIDYSLRNHLARGSDDERSLLAFERRADWLQTKFENSLDYLRAYGLQTSTAVPSSVWEWQEADAGYEYA